MLNIECIIAIILGKLLSVQLRIRKIKVFFFFTFIYSFYGDLPFFMLDRVSDVYHFSLGGTSFNISYKAVLLATNSLSCC